ncbi:NAD(P)H-dependent flavin oxidoreductase [Nonomuraea sp. NPDC050556]|uniref:NAD(P)H-dependent flavin oxidoreductase n=1 Tax=Nonomuraea sp. NPDC050556 TaxID=3364369 RepID=UPI00378B76C7
MTLSTAFTRMMSVQHPIALAPMGGCAGGALATAVSNAGAFGMVGGGPGDRAWLSRELPLVTTDNPWGIGFLTWSATPDLVAWALEYGPAAVMLAFGDPGPLAGLVHEAGAKLIIQVTSLDEARRAMDVGADVIVAQGSEAGGHGGRRGTLPFVPAVVDLVTPTPVLAAGGIADGRGVAAALVLGAAGALVGTRFQTSHEALVAPEVVKALLESRGEDTERSRILDIARGSSWPAEYTARVLRNPFLDNWRGREDELSQDPTTQATYRTAASHGDLDVISVWAGEGLDLITTSTPAADTVTDLVEGAERALASAAPR